MLRYHFIEARVTAYIIDQGMKYNSTNIQSCLQLLFFLAIMHQLYFFSLCCQGSRLETIILRFSCRDNSLYNSLAMVMECTEPKESCQLLRL